MPKRKRYTDREAFLDDAALRAHGAGITEDYLLAFFVRHAYLHYAMAVRGLERSWLLPVSARRRLFTMFKRKVESLKGENNAK